MKRRGAMALFASLLVAGCSRDEGPTAAPAPGTSAPTTTMPALVTTTLAADGVPELPATPLDRCADTPDPADYPAGELPPAIRPCALPTELVVHTIRAGSGRAAQAGDTVIFDHSGIRAATGEMFDATYMRGVPESFPLGRDVVIAGWDDGLVGATAGSLLRLDMPADLAYGNTSPGGGLQPGDAVTFTIELHAVVPSVTAQDAPLELVVEPSVGAEEVTMTELVAGDGAAVTDGSTVVVHLLLARGDNLAVLVNTWVNDDPLQVIMADGNSLPGIRAGLAGARVGARRVLAIPPADGFGATGEPEIGLPPGVDLIVVADVVGVF